MIAVTGAGGFIGARLVALLADAGMPARPLTRQTVRLDDARLLAAALDGCTALVHCAFDGYDPAASLVATRTVGAICAARGLRMVHLSTAAVYEPFPDGTLTEAAAAAGGFTAYQDSKLALERCLDAAVTQHGLDLVILQPTVVYGAGGGAWTDSPVRELLTGTVVLPDAGRGLCNAVHVDDVCRAAMAACTAQVASGQRFLIGGPAPVSWAAFFGYYQTMLGTESLRLAPPGRGTPQPQAGTAAPGRLHLLRRRLAGQLGQARRTRINLVVQQLRAAVLGPRLILATGAKRALYEARCTVSSAKAGRLLGYVPQIELAAGMAMTRAYVQQRYRSSIAPLSAGAVPAMGSDGRAG